MSATVVVGDALDSKDSRLQVKGTNGSIILEGNELKSRMLQKRERKFQLKCHTYKVVDETFFQTYAPLCNLS